MKKPSVEDYIENWRDTFFTTIIETDSYRFIKSIFNDPWYNYIIPKVDDPKDFDWKITEKINSNERSHGVGVSYYIEDGILDTFKPKIIDLGYELFGTDVYLYNSTDSYPNEVTYGKIRPIEESHIDSYVNTAKVCFDEWHNEEKYCRFTLNLSKTSDTDKRENITLVTYEDEIITSFGLILIDPARNVGYIHNTGTHEKYRRMGYFTRMIDVLGSIAKQKGLENVYVLVEKDEASYKGLIKLGFKISTTYNLFSKSSE